MRRGTRNKQPAVVRRTAWIGATLSVVCLLTPPSACSQGQLIFDNHVNNVVVAPVYGLDPAHPTLVVRGNTSAGTPPGQQTYAGPPLNGGAFTAQLFGGPGQAAVANLQPLRPAVPFRAGTAAGFIISPPASVTVPGVPDGMAAKVQLRAWDNRGGTITNWGQVEADPAIPHGSSAPFLTPPLGGAFRAPPNLIGLQSFNLATGAATGLSIKINFQPAAAPIPPGYLADVGQVYGPQAQGWSYGWNTDLQARAQARQSTNSPDLRHDTFIEMQGDSVWEIALSDGLYAVHLAAGDPDRTNGVRRFSIEGIRVIDGSASSTQRWVEADAIVEVSDGRLTLELDPSIATSPICFIEIARIEPVLLEQPRVVSAGSFQFQFQFRGEVGFQYAIEGSAGPDPWLPVGSATPAADVPYVFIDAGLTNRPVQLYRVRTRTTP